MACYSCDEYLNEINILKYSVCAYYFCIEKHQTDKRSSLMHCTIAYVFTSQTGEAIDVLSFSARLLVLRKTSKKIQNGSGTVKQVLGLADCEVYLSEFLLCILNDNIL